jgi:DNA-binding MarR family transcriptional regulator
MKKPDTVISFVTSRVLKLSNTLGLYSSRRYRDEFELTLPEWRVLSVVAYSQPTTAREISRILATDKGWIGLSADSLRRRGYVLGTPDKRDRRRTLLTLTDEGWKKHEAVLSVSTWRQERLLGCLPEGAADLFIECLDRLQAEADKLMEESEALRETPRRLVDDRPPGEHAQFSSGRATKRG